MRSRSHLSANSAASSASRRFSSASEIADCTSLASCPTVLRSSASSFPRPDRISESGAFRPRIRTRASSRPGRSDTPSILSMLSDRSSSSRARRFCASLTLLNPLGWEVQGEHGPLLELAGDFDPAVVSFGQPPGQVQAEPRPGGARTLSRRTGPREEILDAVRLYPDALVPHLDLDLSLDPLGRHLDRALIGELDGV